MEDDSTVLDFLNDNVKINCVYDAKWKMFCSVFGWFDLNSYMQGEDSEDEGDEEEEEDDEDEDDKWTVNGPHIWFDFSSSMFQLS